MSGVSSGSSSEEKIIGPHCHAVYILVKQTKKQENRNYVRELDGYSTLGGQRRLLFFFACSISLLLSYLKNLDRKLWFGLTLSSSFWSSKEACLLLSYLIFPLGK